MKRFPITTALTILILLPTIAFAQEEPRRLSTTTNSTICYYDSTIKAPVCSSFDAIDIEFTPGSPPTYISTSPTDPSRDILRIPNFPLAAYHHWLFDLHLKRAQQAYASCVDRIRTAQRLLNYPANQLIDAPTSPLYDVIVSVRDYQVPFNPIGTEGPPSLAEVQKHIIAAIHSNNLAVFHTGLCESASVLWEQQVRNAMK